MKTKYFFLAAMSVIGFSACSNDNSLDSGNSNSGEGIVFAGTNVAVKRDMSGSRTSADYDRDNHTLTFYWEPNDKIFLNDNNSATTAITAKQARAGFIFYSGNYTASTYDVYYTGANGTSYNTVNIATSQTQNAPNSTSHFGQAGDCGTAQATRQTDGGYKFDLTHHSSYLCFLPRTTNAAGTNWVMTQVKVTSDNNIAGAYTLSTSGLSGTGSSNTITLNTNNFDVTNSQTSQPTNAAFMVIAPGTHSLTVEYTVKNTVSNETATITKTLTPNKGYNANTVYPVTAMLFTDYTAAKYYQWDAPQEMWYGKTPIDYVTGTYNSSDFVTASDPNRMSQETYTGVNYNYTADFGGGAGTPQTTTLYQAKATSKNNPTIQEMVWFKDKGDAHWDDNTAWTFRGKLYKGGMWIKKPGIIAAENGITEAAMKTTFPNPVQNGFEMHGGTNNTIAQGTPTNTANYFFLPTLGSYEGDTQSSAIIRMYGSAPMQTDSRTAYQRHLFGLGESGIFFSSSSNREGPMCLTFSKNAIGTASYGGTNLDWQQKIGNINVGAINMSSIVNF